MTTCSRDPGYANPGPCGPMPCAGECSPAPAQCDLCDAVAEYVTWDQANMCDRCTSETGSEVYRWLGDYV